MIVCCVSFVGVVGRSWLWFVVVCWLLVVVCWLLLVLVLCYGCLLLVACCRWRLWLVIVVLFCGLLVCVLMVFVIVAR